MNELLRPHCQPQEVGTIITLILEMKELRHKEISLLVSNRARIQTQAVCLQSTHSKAQMKIAAINRSQVFSTQRDLRIITNYN